MATLPIDMSGQVPPGAGIFTIFGMLISGIYDNVAASRLRAAEKRARTKAARDARVAERESSAQLQRWQEMTERQMARGKAGDASQENARAALRGSGGRPSKLDDRWF